MCGDDENTKKIKTDKPIFTYGFNENNDCVIKNAKVNGEHTTLDVYIKGEFYDSYDFPFVGDHMLLNAMAVISVCYLENIDKEVIRIDDRI